MSLSANDEAVYRTAPATPGQLNMGANLGKAQTSEHGLKEIKDYNFFHRVLLIVFLYL